MLEKHRISIEQHAKDNGNLDLLTAYIMRETGKDAEAAFGIAYYLYESIDEMIRNEADEDDEDDE
jgi:hypothetical protein